MTSFIEQVKGRAGALARAALALLVAATLVPAAALAPTAEAAPATDPPPSIAGRATVVGIAGYDSLGPNAFYMDVAVDGYDVASYGHNSPHFDDRVAVCINPGDPFPPNGLTAQGRLDWAWNDVDAGIAWYKAVFRFSDIPNGVGTPYQNLGEIYLGIRWSFEGWVEIVKTSSIPAISDGNADYSLAGAVYELRSSADRSLADTLVTDGSGHARSKGVAPGDYYLVEQGAPAGFKVDAAAHGVAVSGGSTSTVRVEDEPLVRLEIAKRSGNTDVTGGNRCYSLEGALYGVYRSEADAESDANRVCELSTDAEGRSKSPLLERGSYFVREVQPPAGYAKDATTYPVALETVLTRLEVADAPQGSPVEAVVGKIDADTLTAIPQGSASLAGAEFSIRYYDGYYDSAEEAEASGCATRAWTVRTGDDGTAKLAEECLVQGSSPLYKNSQGSPIIPLGTVVVSETKAPAGYVLPSPAPTSVQKVEADSELENLSAYNARKLADTVVRGDIALVKAYDPTPEEDTGEMVGEAGVAFDFYASHQFEGATVKDGASPAFTLVTDEEGRADTTGIYVIENGDGTYSERPRGESDAGGVPYDTYLMVQREAGPGLEALDPMVVSVAENASTNGYLLQNGTVQTPIKVVKVDSETGKAVPYPASWQIIDAETGEPVSMATHYPTEQTFDVFTSDSQGRLTLPEKLPWGDYELKEVQAPASEGTGYVLNPVNITFSTADGHDWDNPLEVVFADAPAKGRIEITKTDEATGEAVAGAVYTIQAIGNIHTLDGTLRAHDGEIVDTLTTDGEGRATSKDLYLGAYDVIEAVSPNGFALDTARHHVALDYAGQTVEVGIERIELTDAPTALRIEKLDAATGEAMEGVEFTVASDDGLFEQTVVTDEDGTAELAHLPRGSYTVVETTPSGYATDAGPHAFAVDDQGLIDGKSLLAIRIENTPIQVEFSKTDVATGAEVPGCGLEVYAAGEDGTAVGDALFAWTSTEAPHVIAGALEPGSYVLRETLAAPGYVKAADVAFSVEDSGGIQRVEMKDDFTKVDVSKRDAATEDELPGAKLAIYRAGEDGERAGEPLHEWVSGTEPARFERMEAGDYVLSEDAAPLGYELAQDVAFTVLETGEAQAVVMHDKPTPETPDSPGKSYDKTGFDMGPLAAIAAVAAVGALACLGIAIKRSCGRREEGKMRKVTKRK